MKSIKLSLAFIFRLIGNQGLQNIIFTMNLTWLEALKTLFITRIGAY
jgi:hypothetical protein